MRILSLQDLKDFSSEKELKFFYKFFMSYKRILLKLSGEVLAGSRKYGIDPLVANKIAKIIKK